MVLYCGQEAFEINWRFTLNDKMYFTFYSVLLSFFIKIRHKVIRACQIGILKYSFLKGSDLNTGSTIVT